MNSKTLLCLILTVIFLTGFSQLAITQKSPEKKTYSINHNGLSREYMLYIPSSLKADQPSALVLNLHGGGGNALTEQKFTGMNKTAEKYGFIVAYPQGIPSLLTNNMRTWNAGSCCGRAKRINSDDVSYIKAVINDIEKNYNIDNKRIYSTGMSNGAMMSYRLACEASDKIAAIAPVAGTLNVDICTPVRPVSIIHFHGTDDDYCTFEGGVGKKSISKLNFKSVPYSINTWKKLNICPTEAKVTYKNGDAICLTYGPCKNKSEITLCTIQNMGHTWPGSSEIKRKFLGKYNNDISANEAMWEFFKKHHLN